MKRICLIIVAGAFLSSDSSLAQERIRLDIFDRAAETVTAKPATRVKFKKWFYEPARDTTLDRFSISASKSHPPSFIVSRRVISANTYGPAERVFVYVGGVDDQPPRMAALTNVEGEFKFRLWIRPVNESKGVDSPADLSAYLFVSGKPHVDTYGRLTLRSGKSRRYIIGALRDIVAKKERPR